MIKFNKINGWSYKTTDSKFIVANCGPQMWFTAEVDTEQTKKFGWIIPNENTKQYHQSLQAAQNWIRNYEYAGA